MISFAIPSMKWPGRAAVEVSTVCLRRGRVPSQPVLSGRPVDHITSYLTADGSDLGDPIPLIANDRRSFIGSVIGGSGFILEKAEAEYLQTVQADRPFIKAYLTGQDLLSRPGCDASRAIIDLGTLSLDQAESHSGLIEIVRSRVKPAKDQLKRASYRERWWQFAERCEALYRAIARHKRVLVTARVSKTHAFVFVPPDQVFADAVVVFESDSDGLFAVLQSSLHEWWAWRYCTTMKTDKNYSPGRVFDTFPIASNAESAADVGRTYYSTRASLQRHLGIGLTDIYNLFHTRDLSPAKVAKVSKKSAAEAERGYQGLLELRRLHVELDQAVLHAYGWDAGGANNGTAGPINLAHDFYEIETLPENDRVRYTISPAARKEVLKRLLALNHERAKAEAAANPTKGKKKRVKDDEDESPPALFGGEEA